MTPVLHLSDADLVANAAPLFCSLVARGFTEFHGEARRLVRAGMIRVNGTTALDEGRAVVNSDSIALVAANIILRDG